MACNPASSNREGKLMSEAKNEPPVARVRLSTVQASIWRNQSPDGKAYYSATFDRRFTDKDGKWKNSTKFGYDDLLLLAKVADLAHSEIAKLRAADRATAQSEDYDAEAA
jgi:hypothetical protein